MKKILAWHFIKEDRRLQYDATDLTVEPSYIYSEPGPTELCNRGMHGSVSAFDALQYAPGPVICRVQLWGDIKHGDDKLVAQHREVLAVADVTRELRLFAFHCVRNTPVGNGSTVWDLLTNERSRNAVVVAERHAVGEATDLELAAARSDAWSAAWSAARSDAGSAAASAAWSAARSAAWSAARSDAWSAAWSAARSAAWEWQRAEFERMMLEACK